MNEQKHGRTLYDIIYELRKPVIRIVVSLVIISVLIILVIVVFKIPLRLGNFEVYPLNKRDTIVIRDTSFIKDTVSPISKLKNKLTFKKIENIITPSKTLSSIDSFEIRNNKNLPNDSVALLFDKAINSMQKENYEDVILQCDKILTIKSNCDTAIYLRGKAKHSLNRLNDAILDFNAAIALNQNNYASYLGKGYCFYELGDFSSAMENVNYALKTKANYDKAYFLRSKLFSEMKNYNRAILDVSRAIEIHSHPDYYLQRAYYYLYVNDSRQACLDYKIAIKLGASASIEFPRCE